MSTNSKRPVAAATTTTTQRRITPPGSSSTSAKSTSSARRLVQTQLMLSPVAEQPSSAASVVLVRRAAQCSPVKSARLEVEDADTDVAVEPVDTNDATGHSSAIINGNGVKLPNKSANWKSKQQKQQPKPVPKNRRSKSCDNRQSTNHHHQHHDQQSVVSSAASNSSSSSNSSSVSSSLTTTTTKLSLSKSASLENFFPSLVGAGTRRSERRLLKAAQCNNEADTIDRINRCCQDGLKIVEFPDKGRGVVSTKAFHRDEFVVEYKGDLIDFKTAKQREQAYNSDPTVGCYMYYFVARGVKLCVDATAESPYYGRLLNHSRLAPNCYTKVVCIGQSTHLCLFAKRDISPGEELVYDYGDRDPATLAAHPWLKS